MLDTRSGAARAPSRGDPPATPAQRIAVGAVVVAIAWAWFGGNAWAQVGDDDFGYVEGRIVEIVPRPTPPDGALVLLDDGRVIGADLPLEDPDAGLVLPPYEVGERVELYYAPGPDGRLTYVVSDWVRRPALTWVTRPLSP